MPTKKPIINLMIPENLLERIENYRRRQKSIPPRSEAIRKLIETGLDKLEKKKPKK